MSTHGLHAAMSSQQDSHACVGGWRVSCVPHGKPAGCLWVRQKGAQRKPHVCCCQAGWRPLCRLPRHQSTPCLAAAAAAAAAAALWLAGPARLQLHCLVCLHPGCHLQRCLVCPHCPAHHRHQCSSQVQRPVVYTHSNFALFIGDVLVVQ